MKRISILGATMGFAASLMGSFGGGSPVGIHRVTGSSKRGRQMQSAKTPGNRSKYMPHIGAKEQERASRCYMSSTFNCSGNPRVAPVMHQLSKRAA